jgi:hypothetical protein
VGGIDHQVLVEQAAPRCAATGGCSAFPFARSRSASPAELLLVKKSSLVVMFYFFFILRSSCTLSQEKKTVQTDLRTGALWLTRQGSRSERDLLRPAGCKGGCVAGSAGMQGKEELELERILDS